MRFSPPAGGRLHGRPSLFLLLSLWSALQACDRSEAEEEDGPEPPVPVEVAPIARGTMVERHALTGTLEAYSVVTIVSKVAGRVDEVHVDVGDPAPAARRLVSMGDTEQRQALAMARADLAVAEAQVMAKEAEAPTATRELERLEALHKQSLVADSVLDAAKAAAKSALAALQMAEGQKQRAQAQLSAARTQLAYTQLRAPPLPGGRTRVVSARMVDPGVTVAAGTPLLTLMEIAPLVAVVSVTEDEYASLAVGQKAELSSDALPGERFEAVVERIAPAFDEGSRKARVQLRVDNPSLRLKPGIFVRALLTLQRTQSGAIVPEVALSRRDSSQGVFVLTQDGAHVKFVAVDVGLRDDGQVSVSGPGLQGQVVTVGQERLEDGDPVAVRHPDALADPARPAPADKDDG